MKTSSKGIPSYGKYTKLLSDVRFAVKMDKYGGVGKLREVESGEE